ncbi:MAG TPA: PQQ-binding-like beta-propeller repeat protein [Thermohalobaculum sp.]|nr:PQQ-binding-like beta-propeller repeat protein [Thermohalobaculum sp.]
MPRVALIALLALGGCGLFGGDDDILEGERIRIRPDASTAPASPVAQPLPQPVRNADWSQTNGTASHNPGHLAGPAALNRAWTADAGSGGSDGAVTGRPIVVGGTVYTLDAQATLTAFDAGSGSQRWRTSLVPEGESTDAGYGGGLAADGNRIFAATGFGEVLAIDPASGEIFWRQFFGAPFRAAPAAAGGLVIAVGGDNRATALNAQDGSARWRLQGGPATAGLLGGASPAIAGDIALLPFASGELLAATANNGRPLWNAVLTSGRRGLARSQIIGISGDPMVVGPYVLAANQAGRIIAIDGRSGQRAWTRSIGSPGPMWAADDTVFLVSDEAVLMRLSVRDGATLWATELPAFRNPEKRKDPIAYSGPVLAGGQLLLTDSRGNLIAFDPQSGAERARASLDGGSVTGPVVAGGTVYVLTDRGRLHAFR